MAERIVQAVFYSTITRISTGPVRLRIPSGAAGQSQAAIIACTDYAWDNKHTHWAHYDNIVTAPPAWKVFKVAGRSARIYLTDKPTMEAAEMWLVHSAK